MLDPIDFSIIRFSDCINDALLQRISEEGEIKSYRKGETFEKRGDIAKYMSFIQSGLVRLRLNEADGSLFNLSILGPGNLFGDTALTLDLPVQFDAYCETDVQIIRISHAAIDRIDANGKEFLAALNRLSHERVHTMLKYIAASIKAPLITRTAHFLVRMCQHQEDNQIIYCRQADLAHALAVSRVSMGKSLKSLQQKGLIKLGYGKITIPDFAGLATVGSNID